MKTLSPSELANEARQSRLLTLAESILKELAVPDLSLGYIGNVYLDGTDDRSWKIFLPHPGRVGQSTDCLGGFPTSERGNLLPLAQALAYGHSLARLGPHEAAAQRQQKPR